MAVAGTKSRSWLSLFLRNTMRKTTTYLLVLLPLLLGMVLMACKEDEPIVNPSDPSNLLIEVTFDSDKPKIATIKATADNAIIYELRIDKTVEPYAVNATGEFEYSFVQPGDYEINIRAYGGSGRYITASRFVEIKEPEVGLEQGYTTPLEYTGYQLVWNDEFDGNALNTNDWVYEIGDGCPNLCGWGNNELQYYRRENTWVENGTLIIEARKETFGGRQYTSSRIKTQGKQSFQYGRIDIRALLPYGKGIWPALWMLGNDITSVGWPKCGEIDIMEMIGGNGRENQVHGTLHWDFNGHVQAGFMRRLPSGTYNDEYHVFSIIWDENEIRFFVNDVRYGTIDITPHHMTEFHQPFFFIFNVAVGGSWPGNPDETTIFNQQMKVDYVRVFQKTN